MAEKQHRLSVAVFVMIAWMMIILVGEILQAGQGSLDSLVTEQIVLALVAAPLFLFVVIAFHGWDKRELGLKTPQHWRIAWLPALFVLAFLVAAFVSGLPPVRLVGFVLINTLCVGISEELMFRGIIFRAALAQPKTGTWSAIWITALLFGGVHSLNGFLTGNHIAAVAQSVAAVMSGVWLQAIRLRTRSLYPAMLLHGLWDFSLFMLIAAMAPAETTAPGAAGTPALQQYLAPLMLPLPLFLYGLWLLRGIGRKSKAEVLA